MKFTIEGVFYSVKLNRIGEKKQHREVIEEVKENLKIFKNELKQALRDQFEELEYNIFEKENAYILEKDGKKLILKYNLDYIKKHITYFPAIQVLFISKEVTIDSTLLMDYIYRMLEKYTNKFYNWQLQYNGITNKKYELDETNYSIQIKEIELKYKVKQKDEMSYFILQILKYHIKNEKMAKQYLTKKEILEELQNKKIEIVNRLADTRNKKFKYKNSTISIKYTDISFPDSILKFRVGIDNIILKQESFMVKNRNIEEAKIYKVINRNKKRQKKYFMFYVIDLKLKKSNINIKLLDYNYVRIYTTNKIQEKDIINIMEQNVLKSEI